MRYVLGPVLRSMKDTLASTNAQISSSDWKAQLVKPMLFLVSELNYFHWNCKDTQSWQTNVLKFLHGTSCWRTSCKPCRIPSLDHTSFVPRTSRLANPVRDAEPLRVAIWVSFLQRKIQPNNMIDGGTLAAGRFVPQCSWR
jgi:hypothetical protein